MEPSEISKVTGYGLDILGWISGKKISYFFASISGPPL
jgi:hypothetical protein